MSSRGRIRHLWLFQFVADFAAIAAAYYSTFLVRFQSDWGNRAFSFINQTFEFRETGEMGETLEDFYIRSAPRIIMLILATLVVLYALLDLYPGRRFIRRRFTTWNILLANLAAIILFYTYFYLMRNVFHPRSFFAIVMILNVFFCAAFRSLMDHLLQHLRVRRGIDQCRTLLFGSNGHADSMAQFIESVHPHGMYLVETMAFDPAQAFAGQIQELERMAQQRQIDLILSVERSLSVAQIMQMLEMTDRLNIPMKVLSEHLEILPSQARMPVDFIHGIPLVHFDSSRGREKATFGRRLLSLPASLLTSLILLPFMAAIALAIRMTSRGPALFVQERMGVNRRPFRMYKFRTMYDGADEMRAEIEELNDAGGGLFKIRKDPRVTPVGRFLRRFRLGGLPQFVNVIRGDMAIVGPRPLPRKDFENYYEEWHYSRHSGMPGLTCLWQVSGRSDVDFHNMCILDIYYLRNRNWVLDLKIVLKTFWVVLFAKGAY